MGELGAQGGGVQGLAIRNLCGWEWDKMELHTLLRCCEQSHADQTHSPQVISLTGEEVGRGLES